MSNIVSTNNDNNKFEFKSTPLSSGRLTHRKLFLFSNFFFLVVDVCRASQSILWYLNMSLSGAIFVKLIISVDLGKSSKRLSLFNGYSSI